MPRIDSYTNVANTGLASDDEIPFWDLSAAAVRNVAVGELDKRWGAVVPYVIASSVASTYWQTVATATGAVVTNGADAQAALSAAFSSGRKLIQIAGPVTLLTAVSAVLGDGVTLECVDGGYIQCGPQTGADPNNPPALLTIGGSRTTIRTETSYTINAGALSFAFTGSIGTVAPDDTVMLHSTQLFGPNRSSEQAGEIIDVQRTSANTVYFKRPVRYTYANAGTVNGLAYTGKTLTLAKYAMTKRLTLRNFEIRGNTATMVRQRPLLVQYVDGVNFDNVSVRDGQGCLFGIRAQECRWMVGICDVQDVNDKHGSDSSYANAATTLSAGATAGATSITVASSTGFPTPASGFAWSGNLGASDPDVGIEFTAVIGAVSHVGGVAVRVNNVSGTTWSLATPLAQTVSNGAAVAKNESYLGYGIEFVGCEHVRMTVNGRRCRHVWDVKSFNTRPCAYDVVLTGTGDDCAGPPFSTHGSCDNVSFVDHVSEGSGGHEVFRGLNQASIRPSCRHPRRWTRGLYEKTQAYPAMTWVGEGNDDGGYSGDNFVLQDPYFESDDTYAAYEINGFWCKDRAIGVRITGQRYFAPTTNGVWFSGPATSGVIDIAVDGFVTNNGTTSNTQYTVAATPERRQAAVQFCTETGGTAGQVNRALDVRVIDRGCRGPMLYIEGNATNVAASNSEIDFVGRKTVLGTSQTSTTAQIVRGAGFHEYHSYVVQAPATAAASLVSTVGTVNQSTDWGHGTRTLSGRTAPTA